MPEVSTDIIKSHKRNDAVSIAKGIAIILMVIGHARCNLWLEHYVSMFHMPLFLFMSGYCFKEAYLETPFTFVKRKIKGIWVPFIKWGFVFLCLHNVLYSLNIYEIEYEMFDYINKAKSMLLRMSGTEQLLGGYWFLRSLFVGSIIFYATQKLTQPIKKYYFDGVGLFIVAIITSFLKDEYGIDPFGIARECLAAFFIWSGYTYKKMGNIPFETNLWFILLMLVFVGIGTCFWPAAMPQYKWHLLIPFILTAYAGTIMTFGISKRIVSIGKKLKKVLVFIGNNTLDILTWHFLSFKFGSLLIILIYGMEIEHLSDFPVIEEKAYAGWWCLYLLVGLVIPLSISLFKKWVGNYRKSTFLI